MKNFIKKITALVVSATVVTSLSTFAFAEKKVSENRTAAVEKTSLILTSSKGEKLDLTDFYLISEETTVLSDGSEEISRFYSDVNPADKAAASGSGHFANIKELTVKGTENKFQYWVAGLFRWNSETDIVEVDQVSQAHAPLPSDCAITATENKRGNNMGKTSLWDKKYAYVEYSFTFIHPDQSKANCDVYVDVNVEGSASYR